VLRKKILDSYHSSKGRARSPKPLEVELGVDSYQSGTSNNIIHTTNNSGITNVIGEIFKQ
jgi:hypothetical protein